MYHSWVGQPQEKAVFLNCSYMLLHWLLNRFHSQKRFCRTFPCHTSTNHGFFGLFVCVMKKSITWNFIFFIDTIDMIVLSIEGNIHREILFVFHTHRSIDLFFENFSAKAPARPVRRCCVAEPVLGVFTLLNCFKRLRFTILLIDVRLIPVTFSISRGDKWVPGFSSCEQIKSPTGSSFSSVVAVTGLPDPGRPFMEPYFSSCFSSLRTDTLFQCLLGCSW